MDTGENCSGIDNIADVSGTDGVQNFLAALADFSPHTGTNTVLFQELGCHGCRLDVEPHVVEASYQRQGFLLVFICQRHDHRAVVLHPDAGGDQSLIHGAVQLFVITDGFAG